MKCGGEGVYSELAAACGHMRRPARASSTVQHTFHCRQTIPEINILFAVFRVLNLCGRSIYIIAGTNWENLVLESGTKILMV